MMHTRRTAKRIRVLVDATPRMLRDIIEDAVTFQPDMELVARAEASDLSETLERTAADVVIVAGPDAQAAAHQRLLAEHPQLKMFVVTDDGREAHLLEFRQMPVAQVSPQGLVDAIRAAVAAGDTAQRDH